MPSKARKPGKTGNPPEECRQTPQNAPECDAASSGSRSLVGQRAAYSVRSRYPDAQSGTTDLKFPVLITDQRVSYGKVRVRIEPVGGEGHWWVNVDGAGLEIQK